MNGYAPAFHSCGVHGFHSFPCNIDAFELDESESEKTLRSTFHGLLPAGNIARSPFTQALIIANECRSQDLAKLFEQLFQIILRCLER